MRQSESRSQPAAGYFAALFLRAAQEAFIRSDTASFSLAVIGRRFLVGVASDAVSATGVAAAAVRREEERRAAGFAGAEVPRILSTSFNALISACRRSISLCRSAIAFAMTLMSFPGLYPPSVDTLRARPSALQWVRILAQGEFGGQDGAGAGLHHHPPSPGAKRAQNAAAMLSLTPSSSSGLGDSPAPIAPGRAGDGLCLRGGRRVRPDAFAPVRGRPGDGLVRPTRRRVTSTSEPTARRVYAGAVGGQAKSCPVSKSSASLRLGGSVGAALAPRR